MSLKVYTDIEQGEQAWLDLRCGLLTASQIGKLLTPQLKVADNETSRGLTLTLAAERITGHVEYVHPSFDMMRGTEDEPYARDVYAEHFATVTEVGFIVREGNGYRLGFSPDGLVDEDGIIEIKSRNARTQLATIFNDKVPAANMAQIQAGLVVTGRSWCDYVSFSAGLPLYVKRVYPELNWHDAILGVAQAFEVNVTQLITDYHTATNGLPATERRPDISEITF